jgi:mannose-6-phosphate isomerase
MHPIKFNPILKSTLWGGDKIIPFKGLSHIRQPQVGESWEISDVPNNESIVSSGSDAGKTLNELVIRYKSSLLGEENYKRFGNHFPLLVKFIDACENLSVQVHPNDQLAQARHNSVGKTEMWYIIDNSNGKGHICPGFKKRITPNEFTSLIKEDRISDVLANYAVQSGDVFYLPAGRIHSIGAGCFLVEIQQTSNITYRIYDYNRTDKNGNHRELHTELAHKAIDYQTEEDYRIHYTPLQNEPSELVSCPYFTTSIYDLTEDMTLDYSELDSFVILICIEGKCRIKDNEGNDLSLQKGETILFPATTQEVYINVDEHVKFLETYV